MRIRRPVNLTRYGILPPEPVSDNWMEESEGLCAQREAAPKKKRERPEDVFHVSVRKYLEQAIAPPGCLSRDRVIWFSIESRNSGQTRWNARTGRTYNIEGQIRKARGCVQGVPDVHIKWPGGSGWIELKSQNGAPTERQTELLDRLAQAGAVVTIARTLDDVERALTAWGVPFHARVAA